MNLNKIQLSIFALASFAVGNSQASIINFDDILFPGGNPTASSHPVEGYKGFDWGGGRGDQSWLISPNSATGWFSGTKQPYSHSGDNFSWLNGGTDIELTVHGGGTFDLTSFWVRSWPNIGFNATAHGYSDGIEIFTQALTTTDTYAQITTNFVNIDRFTFTPLFPSSILIDDIDVSNVSSVPVPAAVWLFGSSLMGLIAMKRKSSIFST